jgi:hypothetical protein
VAKFNVYYKINDLFDGTVLGMSGKYFSLYGNDNTNSVPALHYELSRHSDKVWQEWSDGEVRVLKCRGIIESIDMQEFMWVKLAAKEIK